MIQIRVRCDVCPIQKDKIVDYNKLPAVRGLIDAHFTRIGDKSLCNTCMTAYKESKEAMELRHQAERDALMDNLINP